MILTSQGLARLQKAHETGEKAADISLDLGLTKSTIIIEGDTALLPDGSRLNIDKIRKLDEKSCYTIRDEELVKVQMFSPEMNRHYKLVPTKDWPTVTISGVPMHQKTRATPKEDAVQKTSAVKIYGIVLDTCTGLGYTALIAAKKADNVVTVEHDPNILEIARLNPYSSDLFTNKKIKLIEGDIFEVIHEFRDRMFDVIIHDPPTFKLAGELFGRAFYCELYRVLNKRGSLFHYTGRVGIRSGRSFVDEVIKRLKDAGFRKIKKVMDNQAVACQK